MELTKGRTYKVMIEFTAAESMNERKMDEAISDAICELTNGTHNIGEYEEVKNGA